MKVYLTLNTLLFDRELDTAAQAGALASDLGVDAVLVQDLGVAKLLRQTCPHLPLHASTQMTVHSLDGILACAELGITRVVLPREMLRQAIRPVPGLPLEIEVFGHGALCMCYSGQCTLSAVLGGRSGNRPVRPALPPGLPLAGGPADLPPPLPEGPLLAYHLGQLEEMGWPA